MWGSAFPNSLNILGVPDSYALGIHTLQGVRVYIRNVSDTISVSLVPCTCTTIRAGKHFVGVYGIMQSMQLWHRLLSTHIFAEVWCNVCHMTVWAVVQCYHIVLNPYCVDSIIYTCNPLCNTHKTSKVQIMDWCKCIL